MTGIEISLVAIIQKPTRLLTGDMILGHGRSGDVEYRAVGIEPRMELHTPLMRFLDHELKRVIIRLRRLTLYTRQPLAPGFIR